MPGRGSCRSSPTRRAPSAWPTWQPGRHLRALRAALPAGGSRVDRLLPRGGERPDPRGRDQRGRRTLLVDGRRHVVLDAWPGDGTITRLLLDVRLPARRRPDLGRRRPARPRLPDRRDAGRTTLGGEGLWRRSGSSHLVRARPCPTAVPGIRRRRRRARRHRRPRPARCSSNSATSSYVTAMNENLPQPSLPVAVRGDVLRGLYRFREAGLEFGPPGAAARVSAAQGHSVNVFWF